MYICMWVPQGLCARWMMLVGGRNSKVKWGSGLSSTAAMGWTTHLPRRYAQVRLFLNTRFIQGLHAIDRLLVMSFTVQALTSSSPSNIGVCGPTVQQDRQTSAM